MKTPRAERLVDMTHYLIERPRTLVPLTFFANRYSSAKSSISEDLTILKKNLKRTRCRSTGDDSWCSRRC